MPPGSSTARGSPGTRRIPNNSTAGTAARSGAVTTGPSGAQLRTISPVVSAGVAAGMLTGRVRPVGRREQQTGDVMVGDVPATHPGDTLWYRNRDVRPGDQAA